MSKAVYYIFKTGNTTYVNVYADEDTQSGGYINLTRKLKDTLTWSIAGGVGSSEQSSLQKRPSEATRISRCRAKKLLKEHGFPDVQMF